MGKYTFLSVKPYKGKRDNKCFSKQKSSQGS